MQGQVSGANSNSWSLHGRPLQVYSLVCDKIRGIVVHESGQHGLEVESSLVLQIDCPWKLSHKVLNYEIVCETVS